MLPMKARLRTLFKAKFLPFLLLGILAATQSFAVFHNIEHAFHHHDESCDICLGAHSVSASLATDDISLPLTFVVEYAGVNPQAVYVSTALLAYHATAPPFSL